MSFVPHGETFVTLSIAQTPPAQDAINIERIPWPDPHIISVLQQRLMLRI